MDLVKLESMVNLAKTGDSKAIEWIITEYNPFIQKKMRSTFIPGMDTEDIKQELIQSVIISIHKYKGDSSFFWYCIKAMENNIYNKLKKCKKNQNLINIEDTSLFDGALVEDNIINKVEIEELVAAMNSLKDKDRELLKKLYIENKSYEELTIEYGCKYTTITKRKQYALKRLKIYMKTLTKVI